MLPSSAVRESGFLGCHKPNSNPRLMPTATLEGPRGVECAVVLRETPVHEGGPTAAPKEGPSVGLGSAPKLQLRRLPSKGRLGQRHIPEATNYSGKRRPIPTALKEGPASRAHPRSTRTHTLTRTSAPAPATLASTRTHLLGPAWRRGAVGTTMHFHALALLRARLSKRRDASLGWMSQPPWRCGANPALPSNVGDPSLQGLG